MILLCYWIGLILIVLGGIYFALMISVWLIEQIMKYLNVHAMLIDFVWSKRKKSNGE